ncbi:M16 family metallopeptidase [Magnetofaba australis]|uniref:Putative peptidase M16 domain-containing protein n=1 Tax=Magnetofaba australis IT-1 TaxID=1434232 RepID=A0A1Y2K4Q2_9PROT|nr:pitrilysin family protein [Magnetofaba australis]OSM04347.1 putative peptidase M16 domain-containing protein [Magnetofaba australis IT-1]
MSAWAMQLLRVFSLLLALFLTGALRGGAAIAADKPIFFTAESGLRVVLIHSQSAPMIQARLLIEGGSARDPAGKEGLAYLTAWLANEGAGERSSAQFHEALGFYGMSLHGDAGVDHLTLSLKTLSEHAEVGFALLADAALRPRYEPDAIKRAVDDRLDSWKRSRNDPSQLAAETFARQLYPQHPYGRLEEGSPQSILRITREDLLARQQQAIRAPGMVLAVAGDIDEATLRALVAKYFADLPREPGPFQQPMTLAQPPAEAATLFFSKQNPQTAIKMGWVGINRRDPDYFPLFVLNHILGGGGFGSRLTEEVREKRGLTYGVSSYFIPYEGLGPLVITLRTQNATAIEALDVIDDELAKIRNKGVTATELKEAKQYLVGSFPLRLDSLGALAGIWGVIELYHRGHDYLDTWTDKIEAVTLADVQRTAQRLFDLGKRQTVLVGGVGPKGAKAQPIPPTPDPTKHH